jgi:hypothetical protein
MTPGKAEILIVGVDGGATEAKAHEARCNNWERPTAFELGSAAASRKYERLSDYAPLPVAEQLAQRDAGDMQLSPKEQIQGAMWVQAACEAVVEVVAAVGGPSGRPVLVGMGMPGLKTSDRRGIGVINNGPRIPDYLNRLEQRLAEMGVKLVAPVAALGSDADYCGLGELHAADGLFRDVDNAYYVGCGTGIADALKLHGRQVTFDEARAWLQKSWQIPSALGATFEKLVSAKSMNDCYLRLLGCGPAGETRYPEVDAAAGGAAAFTWMGTIALVLAELIFERMQVVKNGRPDAPHRGTAYAALQTDHTFVGTHLDRVIVGQQLGRIYAEPRFRTVFAERLDAALADLILWSGDKELAARHLDGGRLRAGFLRASQLRAAPALGAAIAAVQAYRSE